MTLILFKFLYCSFYEKKKKNSKYSKYFNKMFLFLQNAYQCSCNPRTYVVEVVPEHLYMSRLKRPKPTKWLCSQPRIRSVWASTQSDRVFAMRLVGSYQYIAYCVASHVVICNCITWEMNKFGIWNISEGPKLSSCEQRRLWSDWADAQADLSLRWAHMPFCWFCHEAAHIAMTDSTFVLRWDKQAETEKEKSLTAIERDILAPCVRMVYHRWCNHRSRFW